MRRLLDAFSKRDKPPPSGSSQSTPAFHVPLRSGTNSQLSEFAPSGNSTCSSDQSSTPQSPALSYKPIPTTKARGLRSWLHSRRGWKQTSFPVEDPKPSLQPVKPDRTQRSRAQSDSRSKETFSTTPFENLHPETKQGQSRASLLRSQSAHVQSRPNDKVIPLTPTLSAPKEPPRIDEPLQDSSLKRFCEFTESTLVPSSDPHPFITPSPPDACEFPTSLTPHSLHFSRPSLCQIVHKRNALNRIKLNPSDPRLKEITSRHWNPKPVREQFLEAFLNRDQVQLGSIGLQRWMVRPCFEERCYIYLAEGSEVLESRPISGGPAAVAALEYSESLELLALAAEPSGAEEVEVFPLSATGTVQGQEVTSPQSSDFSEAATAPPPLQPRRGVRFQAQVEEVEPDDLVPLAVVLQAKKRKEERRRTLLLEEEKRIQKALHEAVCAERAKQEDEARRKLYAAEVAATRERRESQRLGFQPGKRTSMISSSSSLSISSADGTPKYGRQDARRSSSSLQVNVSNLLPIPRSRPASYTSSGEDSPNPFSNDRASSTTSLPQFGGSSRSVSSSADSIPHSQQHSRERSTHSTQTRKSSTSTRTNPSHAPVPPVPFLARPWNVPELPLPPANLMQQGPFLASIRTQGAYLQPSFQPNLYLSNAVPNNFVGYPNILPNTQHSRHTQHPSSLPRTHSATSSSNRRISSYGPPRSHSYSDQTS